MLEEKVTLDETAEGDCPFADWFDGLDARAAAKVRTAIARIETGNFGDVIFAVLAHLKAHEGVSFGVQRSARP